MRLGWRARRSSPLENAAVRFLVDANLSPRVAEWLRERGYDAVDVFEQGLTQAGDREILTKAAQEARILLTADLDFGDLPVRSSGTTSTVVFRTRSTATSLIVRRLEKVLAAAEDPLRSGAILIVEDARIRIRRLTFRE